MSFVCQINKQESSYRIPDTKNHLIQETLRKRTKTSLVSCRKKKKKSHKHIHIHKLEVCDGVEIKKFQKGS